MAGDDLVFQAAQPTTASNDFPAGTAFNSLDIASGNFTLAGNGLQLGSSFTVGQNATGVCALPIAVSGQITVEVDSATPLVLSGVVSGQGSLVKTGSGSLTLSGPNIYGGPTTITTGTLPVGGYTDPTNYLTPVGAFSASPGPYGTFDMGGDVLQWDEAKYGTVRGQLAGDWFDDASILTAGVSSGNLPASGNYQEGFRVASIPEPSSLALLAIASLAASAYLFRRRK